MAENQVKNKPELSITSEINSGQFEAGLWSLGFFLYLFEFNRGFLLPEPEMIMEKQTKTVWSAFILFMTHLKM